MDNNSSQAERTIRRQENREYGLVYHVVEKGLVKLKEEYEKIGKLGLKEKRGY